MTDFWRDSAKSLRLSPRLQGVLQLLLHELLRSNITFHRPPKRNTPCYWVESSLQQHSQDGVVRTALFNAVHGYLDTWRKAAHMKSFTHLWNNFTWFYLKIVYTTCSTYSIYILWMSQSYVARLSCCSSSRKLCFFICSHNEDMKLSRHDRSSLRTLDELTLWTINTPLYRFAWGGWKKKNLFPKWWFNGDIRW